MDTAVLYIDNGLIVRNDLYLQSVDLIFLERFIWIVTVIYNQLFIKNNRFLECDVGMVENVEHIVGDTYCKVCDDTSFPIYGSVDLLIGEDEMTDKFEILVKKFFVRDQYGKFLK